MDNSRLNGTTQTITVTSTSASVTTAFAESFRQVRVVANLACHLNFFKNETSTCTTNFPFLPANWPEYYKVVPGQKLSAVNALTGGVVTSSVGTLWVTEVE